MPGMEEHLFWIASRAAGTAALLLSSAAVGVGLTMGGRLVKGRGVDLRAAHEALSLATLIAIVVHAVALLGDSYLNSSVLGHHGAVRLRLQGAVDVDRDRVRLGPGRARRLLLLPHQDRRRALEAPAPLDRARLARSASSHSLGEGTDAGTDLVPRSAPRSP